MNLAKETLPGTVGAAWGKKWGTINLPPVYLQVWCYFFFLPLKCEQVNGFGAPPVCVPTETNGEIGGLNRIWG